VAQRRLEGEASCYSAAILCSVSLQQQHLLSGDKTKSVLVVMQATERYCIFQICILYHKFAARQIHQSDKHKTVLPGWWRPQTRRTGAAVLRLFCIACNNVFNRRLKVTGDLVNTNTPVNFCGWRSMPCRCNGNAAADAGAVICVAQ
jgi:hypothetical protein